MSDNPFSLQKDSKRFFQTVAKNSILEPERTVISSQGKNRIKRLNQQIEILAKEREEMLFKDAQVNFIFKKQKPAIKLEDYIQKGKEMKKKSQIKQKKQTLHEYISKKKEIFLSKMNINIKKQETNKLQDYIKDEQETLRARQLYYKNDVQFMNNFISQVKKEAEAAQPKSSELDFAEGLTRTLTSLQIEIQKKKNLISKAEDDFKNLSKYKQFLDKFLHLKNSSWRPYKRVEEKQEMFFITQQMKPNTPGEDTRSKPTIILSPQNLLEIFNQILENNLSEIQNSHDAQNELQKINKEQKRIKDQNQKNQSEYQERCRHLEKSLSNQLKRNQKLKQMKKNNTTKIKITDNQDLDVEKMGAKIAQIYREINHKSKSIDIKSTDSKQLKKYMKEIEHELSKLSEQIQKQKLIDPLRNQQIEKEIKQNYKKQNLLRKLEMTKQMEQRKMNEESKKRQQSEFHLKKGRRDMAKVLVEKPNKQRRVQVLDSNDKDEKFFKEDNSEDDES